MKRKLAAWLNERYPRGGFGPIQDERDDGSLLKTGGQTDNSSENGIALNPIAKSPGAIVAQREMV